MLINVLFDLEDSAGTDVAAAVVGLRVLALGHAAVASRVDEVEGVVVVHLGDDAHVAHAATARTALEEHEVTRLQVFLLHTHTVKDLAPGRTIQLDAEALEHVTGET